MWHNTIFVISKWLWKGMNGNNKEFCAVNSCDSFELLVQNHTENSPWYITFTFQISWELGRSYSQRKFYIMYVQNVWNSLSHASQFYQTVYTASLIHTRQILFVCHIDWATVKTVEREECTVCSIHWKRKELIVGHHILIIINSNYSSSSKIWLDEPRLKTKWLKYTHHVATRLTNYITCCIIFCVVLIIIFQIVYLDN